MPDSVTPPVTAQESAPVLAFYYAWFDETTWTSGQPADIPSSPYRSTDPATIERHVSQAKGAGINAFVQSWYGPRVEANQTETNFRVLLDTAARHQFQAAVDVEVSGPFFPDSGSVQGALATLMSTHVHHPAYLRYRGKPVIFFWRQQRFGVATWAAIREVVDPGRTTYWIAEGTDLAYQDVFDGHHLYSIAWSGNPRAELGKWPARIRRVEERLGADRLWVATAMPGYNDLNLPRADAFVQPRREGAYFRETWAAAQATNPDMIIITSFNEWLEGTHLEPSITFGDFYLNLARELIGQGGPPLPEPAPSVQRKAPPAQVQPAQVPASLPAPPLENPGLYQVQAGDTLSGIASRFGLSVEALVAANALPDPDRLSIDQVLQLPGAATGEAHKATQATEDGSTAASLDAQTTDYVVQANDTLSGLAAARSLPVAAILALNDLPDPDRLQIGQVLRLPMGAEGTEEE